MIKPWPEIDVPLGVIPAGTTITQEDIKTIMNREDILREMSDAVGLPRTVDVRDFRTEASDVMRGKAIVEQIRKFDTGATRDTDIDKHDPEGFLSPLVIDRFNEFMHKNRVQRDGSLRGSDNWQKGIPMDAYMASLWRHFLDLWLHHRGFSEKAREDMETALCAILFNASGYLFEILQIKRSKQTRGSPKEMGPY